MNVVRDILIDAAAVCFIASTIFLSVAAWSAERRTRARRERAERERRAAELLYPDFRDHQGRR